ncbi:rCG28784 [Rattus norvegicus]|uniref:RCG28784 n=1 Tax=Rattus norvegicus TaxID=10116 RepID=A6HUS9_RAT|nr:rCG28784 [Rattus norvegicus]
MLLGPPSYLRSRINSPEWCHPQWTGPSHTNHQSRKCPADLPTGQLDEAFFSVKIASFQIISACVKKTKSNHRRAFI